ncbi:CDP-glucose 4,6-dehydratase [Polymorphobacter sp.]|uniref:CDP-glucose 4,6-dehydratase n=1 Tax=Polymorphobacter sp. TaxID=1909290 RepID=UPI003F6EED7F
MAHQKAPQKPRLPDRGFWRGQRVLLTGHTGFKGSWAALWLEQMGAIVHGLALAPDHVPDLHSQLAPFRAHHSMIEDITDAAAVRAAIDHARPTLVLHMAAQPLVRAAYADPARTFATNVQGTVNLLDALAGSPDVKAALVVTTDKVYRNTGCGRRFVESDPLGGEDPYSASKAGTELVTAAYAHSRLKTLPLATARGGNVIGGGDWSADRLIPDVWRALHAGQPLQLRYPAATRPWQHVLDCLAGYFIHLEALATTADAPRALNFGPAADDPALPVAEVAEVMAKALGLPEPWQQAPGLHPPEAPALALDSAAATARLGWRPRLAGAEALQWTADWYRGFDAGTPARALSLAQLSAYEAL